MNLFSRYFTFLFLSSLLLTGCASPKKLLGKGDYFDAVMLSVDRLKRNAGNQKARETLEQAYPLALEALKAKLKKGEQLQPAFRYTDAAYTYNDLNRMYEAILQSPAAKQIIENPKPFYKEQAEVKPLAAEEQYRAGMDQLAAGGRDHARQAYYYFQDADNFVKNYKDVEQRIREAYDKALLYIIADLKPVYSKIYQLSANTFYRELENSFKVIEQDRFIKFYSPKEAEEMQLKRPDQILSVNFEDFIVGETHTAQRIEDVSRDSIRVRVSGSENKRPRYKYITVHARVYLNHMEVISRGIVNMHIYTNDRKKTMLFNENYPGDFVWFNDWGYFEGDRRALTAEQVEIINRRKILPPPPQQMFVEFTRPIYEQINIRLKEFYDRY